MRRNAMGRWIGLGLGLGVLALGSSGCGLQSVSAGQVGCPPSEIVISNTSTGWSTKTWTATCRGRSHMCSAVATGKNNSQVNCTPMQAQPGYATRNMPRSQPAAGGQGQGGETASVTRGFNEKANISFVRADFKLAGAELRVMGAPQVELGRLVFTASGGSFSRAAKCDRFEVVVNGRPTAAAMGAIKRDKTRFSTEGSLEFTVFKPLASQFPEFSVRMCSETWKFTEDQVTQLRKFLVMYSELAQEVQAAETPAAASQTF